MEPRLKMSIPEIRNKIDLSIHPWENVYESNCYAFALGLDVPEKDVATGTFKSAYRPGIIASVKLKIPYEEFNTLSMEERLLLDLKVLKIAVQEADVKDESYIETTKNYERLSWIISRYKATIDFHFVRKTTDQEWWHKKGYLNKPRKLESGINPIPLNRKINYEHVKTYRLTMTRKKRDIF